MAREVGVSHDTLLYWYDDSTLVGRGFTFLLAGITEILERGLTNCEMACFSFNG